MGEIILGAKRQPRSRRVVRRIALGMVILALLLTISYIAFRRATTYSVPHGTLPGEMLAADGNRLTLGTSSLERTGSLWVLRVGGNPYTMGAATARLLGSVATDGDDGDA